MTFDDTVGCFTSDDCDPTEECYSGQCVNPCRLGSNPCPPSATCHALAHAATCMCPPSHTGVPLQGCTLMPVCGFNYDCPKDEACIERLCQDPCKANSCPEGSVCSVTDHRPVCLCPVGYTGTPETACIRSVCARDDECPAGRVCQGGACQDPCSECGRGAICQKESGLLICLCPSGFTGNPRLGCGPSKTLFTYLSFYMLTSNFDLHRLSSSFPDTLHLSI